MQLRPTNKSTRVVSERLRGLAIVLGIAAAGSALPPGSFAQDAARVEAGLKLWQSGGCAGCHGDFAEGGRGGEQPAGPSLRRTRLTREQFVETISCGRPGTGMPANLSGAYMKTSCYGL